MHAGAQSANAYLRTKAATASPEELRMMLLEGAVKFAHQGRDGLARADFEAAYNGLSQCRNIMIELASTIRDDVDKELADRVRALYTFIVSEMLDARMARDLPRLDRAIQLVEYERETWRLLLEKLAAERANAAAASDPPSPAPGAPALSVQG